MKPLSAVSAPILAQLYRDQRFSVDDATAELRRMTDENLKTIDRLTAGERPKPTSKETT